ncbi:MAG: hypothetical protein HDR21_14990 [Lachnospiraceae bacterium]|nr:hypothetical protein [Lachnospiraceae bacterium]MBD5482242.1 hypothetical protein [Lachnospiraceae bacterium]
MRVGEKRDGVISVSFAIGQDEQAQGAAGKKQGKTKSVQMGAPMQQNPVQDKKEAALRKARKIVSDVFEEDNKVTLDMEKRRANIKKLKGESRAAQTELNKINNQKAEWKTEYGIADDSQEQKDLELLEKRQDSQWSGSGIILTPEEKERLAEIDEKELTEYQKRSLEVNKDAGMYRSIIESNKPQIKEENDAIYGLKQSILAKPYEQGMGFAQDTAEDIKLAASKEAAYGMINEVKDKVDEETKEAQEKAEERKAEKEEKEEKLEARKEQEEAQEERIQARRESKAEREQTLERNRERAAEQKKEAESLREKIAEKTKTEKTEESPAEKPEEERGTRRKDDTEETEDRNEKQSYTITELSQEKDTVQEDVKRELNKLGLTGEDAKGVAVDKYI